MISSWLSEKRLVSPRAAEPGTAMESAGPSGIPAAVVSAWDGRSPAEQAASKSSRDEKASRGI